MKKRVFSIFLVLALILTGCGPIAFVPPSESPNTEDSEAERPLGTGYYEVNDEDGELVGYLRVTGSKLIVFDQYGSEGETLRYDYDAERGRYTLDDGELFGCWKFTVEKGRDGLTLITEDDGEYTLRKIEKGDLPSGGPRYIELPVGCYAAHDDGSLAGYLKVTERTMTFYEYDGEEDGEFRYSYDRDGQCVVEEDGSTLTYQFTCERGNYYMHFADREDELYLLEPISESEIPVYDDGPSGSASDAYYIGGNGSMDLYAWMPEALYDDLDAEYEDGFFTAEAECYDIDTDSDLFFLAILASDDYLQSAIDESRAEYDGAYSSDPDLLFRYLRDNFFGELDNGYLFGEYVGDDLDYDLDEGYVTINGRSWRYCEFYAEAEDAGVDLALLFWMEGSDMAAMVIGGIAEDPNGYGDMSDILTDIAYSVTLAA